MNFFHQRFIHQVLPHLDVEHQIVDLGFRRDTVHHLFELLVIELPLLLVDEQLPILGRVDQFECPLKFLLILGAPLLLHVSSACGFNWLLN